MKVETHGVLSAVTGILMGDLGALYEVTSYLIDRPAYSHELAHYHERVKAALLACHPELPSSATEQNWQAIRDRYVAEIGETMELNPALKGVIADDKDPITTLREMGFKGEVILASTKQGD